MPAADSAPRASDLVAAAPVESDDHEEGKPMSQAKKGGLGRGLAALIPTGPAEVQGLGSAAANAVIGLDRIGPHRGRRRICIGYPIRSRVGHRRGLPRDRRRPDSSRTHAAAPGLRQEALAELVHSIREFGLMQPIVVRALDGRTRRAAPRYQLVMGERRWRASQEAGLTAIPAIVRETAEDNLLRDALLENIHRVQLNPLEEAAAYQQLLDEFDVTHEELAARIGRSRPVITNMIRLLRLPIPVQRRVAAGVLSAGHARALLSLEAGAEAQESWPRGSSPRGCRSGRPRKRSRSPTATEPSQPAAPRRKPIQMPGLQDVAERLSSAFDTRVTVSLGKRKGKIVVEFGSVDDLQRIVDLMNSSKS